MATVIGASSYHARSFATSIHKQSGDARLYWQTDELMRLWTDIAGLASSGWYRGTDIVRLVSRDRHRQAGLALFRLASRDWPRQTGRAGLASRLGSVHRLCQNIAVAAHTLEFKRLQDNGIHKYTH